MESVNKSAGGWGSGLGLFWAGWVTAGESESLCGVSV